MMVTANLVHSPCAASFRRSIMRILGWIAVQAASLRRSIMRLREESQFAVESHRIDCLAFEGNLSDATI